MAQRKTGKVQALPELRENLTKKHPDPENKTAPSPHAHNLRRTEGKYFKVGEVAVTMHSYWTTLNPTSNQDEAARPWALAVACGQVCILFFLEGGFSMNQDHNSPPPSKLVR